MTSIRKHFSEPIVWTVLQYSTSLIDEWAVSRRSRKVMDYYVFQVIAKSHSIKLLIAYCVLHKWIKGLDYLLRQKRAIGRPIDLADHLNHTAVVASNSRCYAVIKYLCDHPVFGRIPWAYKNRPFHLKCAIADHLTFEKKYEFIVNAFTVADDKENAIKALQNLTEGLRRSIWYELRSASAKQIKYAIDRIKFSRDEIVVRLQKDWYTFIPESIHCFTTYYDISYDELNVPARATTIPVSSTRDMFKYLMSRKDFNIGPLIYDANWIGSFVYNSSVSDIITLLNRVGVHDKIRTATLMTKIIVTTCRIGDLITFNYIIKQRTYRRYVDWEEVARQLEHGPVWGSSVPLRRITEMRNSSTINKIKHELQ